MTHEQWVRAYAAELMALSAKEVSRRIDELPENDRETVRKEFLRRLYGNNQREQD